MIIALNVVEKEMDIILDTDCRAGVLNVVAQGRATYIKDELLLIGILTTHGFQST